MLCLESNHFNSHRGCVCAKHCSFNFTNNGYSYQLHFAKEEAEREEIKLPKDIWPFRGKAGYQTQAGWQQTPNSCSRPVLSCTMRGSTRNVPGPSWDVLLSVKYVLHLEDLDSENQCEISHEQLDSDYILKWCLGAISY